MFHLAIIGNPNCGKTTLFNGLTGSKQHIGNWPGVTVEKKEGEVVLEDGTELKVTDLPGVYSLVATSEDERASLDYVLSHEADLYVNVVDATALERNLYLTLLMCELKVPMVLVVTMMDVARQRNIEIELDHLSEHLGIPVLGLNANNPLDVRKLLRVIQGLIAKSGDDSRAARGSAPTEDSSQFLIPHSSFLIGLPVPTIKLDYGNELEQEIDILASASVKTAEGLGMSSRWVALKALEGDPVVTRALIDYHDMAPEVLEGAIDRVTRVLKDPPDIELAEARYGIIAGLVHDVVHVRQSKVYLSEKIDRFVLNRFLGIPIFFGVMFFVFWLTQAVGGAFVDFFDIAGDTIFVSGVAYLLELCHAPAWLTAIVAHGAGTALRTVGTFLPPVGFMFLCLSVLEDSGYMARAAFVMDRFMRWIGLPGKSFVPMLVGFGCTVPAIMATRTLESKRDRMLTVFMTPFMSCGAKLPVWTLFAAAFFPRCPGRLVFIMYLTGIVLGVVTGLILRHTLFQGDPTHFIMELPPYHVPRPKHIFLHTWERLGIFIWRAGKFIVPMVVVLGVLNTVGTDGSVGREGSEKSMLAVCGRAVTPVFEPIGVEPENWPASVAVFTGLFAKESVIGTMKGLYGQMDAKNGDAMVGTDLRAVRGASPTEEYSFFGGMKAAVVSVPRNLAGVFGFGAKVAGESDAEAAANAAAADSLRRRFPKGMHQMFAYLLFILLYVPCVAATGVVFREIGKFYGAVFVAYLTLLGWSTATVYHAVMVSGSALWFSVGAGILVAMFTAFWIYGRRHKVNFQG